MENPNIISNWFWNSKLGRKVYIIPYCRQDILELKELLHRFHKAPNSKLTQEKLLELWQNGER